MFSAKNNVFSSAVAAGAVIALNLLVSGCASTKGGPGVVVGNATENIFSEAVITAGTNVYSFAEIDAFSVSQSKKRISAFSKIVSVEWASGSGVKGKRSITLGKELLDYPGQIQFQVDSKGVVKVFTAPAKASGDSVLPWSLPADWEGTPSIPGMNQ
jgi:hypothetical protein